MSGEGESARGTGDVREAVAGSQTTIHGDTGRGPTDAQGTRSEVGRGRGGAEMRMVPKERPSSYHGRPIVKEPTWTWEIPWYFFTGGLAGGSSMLGLAASLSGNRPLARRAWLISLGGIAVSPALLISDLGRPERFYNMLRVFKVTSPMSVGSWILSLNGAAIVPVAYGALRLRPPRIARAAEPVAALAGLGLATYTAVLVANSAIPVWSEARRELPLIFAAGAGASAGAAAVALTPPSHSAPARRLAVGGAVAEIVAIEVMKRRLGALGEPYHQGRPQIFGRASRLLSAAGAGLLASGRRRRARTLVGAAMVLAGAACERWSVFEAGFLSARDPAYTVDPQRERVGAVAARDAGAASGGS